VTDRLLIRVSEETIEPAELLTFVADPAAGGTCLFSGSVRDHSEMGVVTGLRYEAWRELAERRLEEIATEMLDGWPIQKAALVHRFGELAVGDVSVVVACSAPHRDQAFEACRHGIERLKADVPIWKKEVLASGESEWVTGS
jgi:molybdopterin synthase catalytic subunit